MKIVLNEGDIPLNSVLIKSTTNTGEQTTPLYDRKTVEGDGSAATRPPLSTVSNPKNTMTSPKVQTIPPNSPSSKNQDIQTNHQKEKQTTIQSNKQFQKKNEPSETTSTKEVRIGGHLTGQSRRSAAYQQALQSRPKYTQHARIGSDEFREEAKKHVLNQENRGVCTKENCRAFRGSTRVEFDDSTDCMNFLIH